MKNVFLIILITLAFCCMGQEKKDSIYSKVDVYPCFEGCSMFKNGSMERINCSNERVLSYVKAHLIYPERDIESSNEGTIYVQFVVNEDGDIKEVKALNKLGIDLEKAAVDVVKNMPLWIAGTIQKVPVKVKMTIPIQFKLDQSLTYGYILSWGDIGGKNIEKQRLKKLSTEQPLIRDKLGNEVNCIEIVVERFQNDEVTKLQNRTELSSAQSKLIKKCKVGDTLRITVTIPQKGDFIYLDKTYNIIK